MKTYKSLTHNKRQNNAQVLYLSTISNNGDKNNHAVRTRHRMIGTSQRYSIHTISHESDTLKTQCIDILFIQREIYQNPQDLEKFSLKQGCNCTQSKRLRIFYFFI